MRQLMADTIVKIGALAASFYERDPESVGLHYAAIEDLGFSIFLTMHSYIKTIGTEKQVDT